MSRKRYSNEDALKILREIDVHLHHGLDVVSSCRKREFQIRVISILTETLIWMSDKKTSNIPTLR